MGPPGNQTNNGKRISAHLPNPNQKKAAARMSPFQIPRAELLLNGLYKCPRFCAARVRPSDRPRTREAKLGGALWFGCCGPRSFDLVTDAIGGGAAGGCHRASSCGPYPTVIA